MRENITVPTGKVIGIGKIKVFPSDDFPYVIPTLHFVVAKTEQGEYTASCMQLLQDGAGSNEHEAVARLNLHCKVFLEGMFQHLAPEDAWEQLHELMESDCAKGYWDAYNNFQLNFAERGIDLKGGTAKLYQERLRELEEQIEILKNAVGKFQLEVVGYRTMETAA